MQGIMRKTFILMIAAIVMTAGFGMTLEQASAVTGPTSITVKAESGTTTYGYVDINGKAKVYVYSVYPSTRSKSVTWSIYSGAAYGKIASKTSTYCYVQGIKTGTVVIKAKSNYYPYATKYIKMYVKQLYPTGVTLSRTSLNLWKPMASTLTATVVKKPWVYSAGVTWTSSNAAAATVRTTGVVDARGAGTSTVTATSNDLGSLKATCKVNVYDATVAQTERISMELNEVLSNPVTVSGPDITGPGDLTPARTIGYVSSNPTAVTVDSTGKLTAKAYGSATITATVTMPSISLVTKTKIIKYIVNVKEPVTTNDFTIGDDRGFVELTRNSDGFLGDTAIVLSKSQLDDLFGYGSLGINLWNPMDMYLNFQPSNISLHGGDFSFDKVNQSNPTIADVTVLAKVIHKYWLDDTAGDKNAVDLTYDGAGLTTGYSLKFYYDSSLSNTAFDEVSLLGNVLTLKFDTVDLAIERLASNKVQLLADTDYDTSTAMAPVMTLVRNTTNYQVIISDADYLDEQGIDINLYKTYL